MKRASLILAGLLAMGAGQALAAPLVGVTFYSSGGAPQWTNETALGTTNNLRYETGANSGISLNTSVSGAFSPYSVSVNSSTIPGGDANLGGVNGNFYGENSFTGTLSHLNPGETYDVWLFATRQNYTTDQLVTIAGAGTTTFSQIDGSTRQLMVNSLVGSSSNDLGYYAVPIVASSSGDITITVDNEDGGYGAAVSGIALTAVPEPSAWAMMFVGLCGMGAALRSRRRVATAQA